MANLQFAQSQLKQSLENQPDREPDEEYAAATRKIGTTKEVDGETKYWSGQNYGWQSKASYDKLEEEYEFNFGTIARKRLQQSAGTFLQENIPEQVKEAGRMVIRGGKVVYDASPEWLQETLKLTGQIIDYSGKVVGEEAAEAFGIDPFLGEVGVDLATGLGAAKSTKYVTKAGAIRIAQNMDAPPVQALTATNREILDTVGVKAGDTLVDAGQGKRLTKRTQNIEKTQGAIDTLNDQIGTLMELKGDPKNLAKYLDDNPELKDLFDRYSTDKDPFGKVMNRLREQRKGAQESLSRYQSNVLPEDADNPFFFRSKKGMAAKKAQEIKEGVTGYLEQHHLFPKGASAAFFGKMDELISKGIADADDLVLMAQYAKKRGMEAGDYKANMLNMRSKPHNEMHTVLRELGEEPSKSFLQNQLKDVKSTDDLLVKWKEFLDDTASYNIDTAKTWEPLDNLLKELRSN